MTNPTENEKLIANLHRLAKFATQGTSTIGLHALEAIDRIKALAAEIARLRSSEARQRSATYVAGSRLRSSRRI